MAHPAFGDGVDSSNPIRESLRIAPVLCSTDVKLLLTDRYETTYGICNHNIADPSRPLLLVAMHASEDASNNSMMYDRLEQFADFNVPKHFGLSLNEFLELPRDIVTKILEISARRSKVETNTASDMLTKLENIK